MGPRYLTAERSLASLAVISVRYGADCERVGADGG